MSIFIYLYSTMFYCNINNCDHKCKSKSSLKRHKAYKHNIDVKWRYCKITGCDKKFKTKGLLNRHIKTVHKKITRYDCKLCNDYSCYDKYTLDTHINNTHELNINWHYCKIDGCNHKSKTNVDLKSHMSRIHNINVKWFQCNIDNCESKFKSNPELISHKSFIHNINVKWYYCDFDECDSRFKANGLLTRHKSYIHDIGKYVCDFCYKNRNSRNTYKDDKGSHKICRDCYNKATGKLSRIEHKWSDYLDEHIGKEYLLSSDKSLRSSGGCQLYRPDKLYTGIDRVELLECDENQHKWDNGDYTCDEKRISDIYEEKGICGKNMTVIRWNPHAYKNPDGYTKAKRKERLETIVKLIKHLRENPSEDKIHIYYMYYNEDSPRISLNYPVTMIYAETDFL